MTETRTPLTHARPTKDGRIAVRATSEERALIAQASEITATTVSDFVLRASIARAEDVLAERRTFRLSEEQWTAFTAMLDRPVTEKPREHRVGFRLVEGTTTRSAL